MSGRNLNPRLVILCCLMWPTTCHRHRHASTRDHERPDTRNNTGLSPSPLDSALIPTYPPESEPFPPPPWISKPGQDTENVLGCCEKYKVAQECMRLCHPHEVAYWFEGAVVCKYMYWHIVDGCWTDGIPLERHDIPTSDPPYRVPGEPRADRREHQSPLPSHAPPRCSQGALATGVALALMAMAAPWSGYYL